MKTSEFDYILPKILIAQYSVEPRDQSRLLVLDRHSGACVHRQFYRIIDELRSGDVLVLNDTKVFRARLPTTIMLASGVETIIEVFLLRTRSDQTWEVLLRPGRKVSVGQWIHFGNAISGEITRKNADGTADVAFNCVPEQLVDYANLHGEIPIPSYVKTPPASLERYQTVYARETGSVAAPTAGFHFTNRLLDALKEKGVEIVSVTLHVGIGTFRPMKTETIEEHVMHSETVSVSEETASCIQKAKQEGRRVIAVGTTTARTLEGVAKQCEGIVCPFRGDVNLFIKPGFTFQVIDGLITNFHLPKSTLLVLVSTFAGRASVLRAYKEAVNQSYRFFSFGDAMFIR